MPELRWKQNANVNEDVKSFVADAFHRKSTRYNSSGTWNHNNIFEFLGFSAEGVDDVFKPSGNILALDLETTGVEAGSDIVQFYSRPYNKDFGHLGEGFELFAKPNPGTSWEPKALELAKKAGLTDSVINSGVSQQELKQKLVSHLDDLVSKHGKFHALGSNVRFDLNKLAGIVGEDNMGKYFHDEVLDTMSLSAYSSGKSGKSSFSHGLEAVLGRLGITNKVAHNARYDTEASVAAYVKMLESISKTEAVSVAKSSANVVKKAIKTPNWKALAAVGIGLGVIGMASRDDPEPVVNYDAKSYDPATAISPQLESYHARVPEYAARPHTEQTYPTVQAINHAYRNQSRHAVGYVPRQHSSHPVRSRAERSHV